MRDVEKGGQRARTIVVESGHGIFAWNDVFVWVTKVVGGNARGLIEMEECFEKLAVVVASSASIHLHYSKQ